MPSSLIRRVNDLKDSLSAEHAKGDGENDETCIDLLSRLDELPIDLNTLTETLIGTVVSKLKKSQSKELVIKAKTLIKKWKSVASQNGATKAPSKKKSNLKRAAAKPAQPVEESANTSEWDYLPPFRKKMANKFYSLFQMSKGSLTNTGVHADAITQLTTSRAGEVEEAINAFAGVNKTKYSDKLRSLVFNLKKNGALRENVILGQISAEDLVKMPPESLITVEKSQENQKKVASLKDSRRLDWEQANESKINEMCGIKGDLLQASLFTCGRCKSHKTTSTQKQTRSADEPMTVFVLCLNCGKRWRT